MRGAFDDSMRIMLRSEIYAKVALCGSTMHVLTKCNSCRIAIQWYHVKRCSLVYVYIQNRQLYIVPVQGLRSFFFFFLFCFDGENMRNSSIL